MERKKMIKKHSLLLIQSLIISLTLIAVVVVILVGSKTHREMKKIAIEQFNQQQLILAGSIATGIDGYYKELSQTLSSMAKLPAIQQLAPECLQQMQHAYWGFPQRTSVRLIDSNGILRYIYPYDGWRGELIGRDYSNEKFFQNTRKAGRISVSRLIVNEQGEKRIRFAVPVYLTNKTETIKIGDNTGIVITTIDKEKRWDASSRGNHGEFLHQWRQANVSGDCQRYIRTKGGE